ncbi:hypothetical protein [Sphingobacterium sp. DR205]|uniref:hypothetical protein n=1 Tax=Sphingobacterium sp. DR205 TaxID=2713573 RepID=UPI0013E442F7|nr:hypothetical protein [Sphingobacterium sp. DR205]QIH32670.1 hypothetical protein G6053_07070 [Sphingobacterium sp. DR205]
MKKILSIVLLSSLIFGSCSQSPERETEKIRFMFKPGTLKFITSSFNTDKQTMSALYGNPPALSLLSDPGHPLEQPASLKLVTYRMQDDPHYFGSKVNGELILVEKIQSRKDGQWEYEAEYGEIPPDQSRKQRIALILDSQPVKFPQ